MPNRPELQNSHKGIMRTVRSLKKVEAEQRNAKSNPSKRRSFWREMGFIRESEAAAIVLRGVAEGQAAIDDMLAHQAGDHPSLWSVGPDLERP